jgi:hypothetical protein
MREVIVGRRIAIVSSGIMTDAACDAAKKLIPKGIFAGVINISQVHPFDSDGFLQLAGKYKVLLILEEDAADSDVGSMVIKACSNRGNAVRIEKISLSEKISPEQSDLSSMRGKYWISAEQITKQIFSVLEQDSAQNVEGSSTGIAAQANNNSMDQVLDVKSFALLLGVGENEINAECRRFIAETDFHYRFLNPAEKDNVIYESLRCIEEGVFSPSGPHRKDAWEKGWSENLNAFCESDGNTDHLIPRFVRRNAVMRLNGEYVKLSNPNFETAFVTVLRMVLFKKYFEQARSIYEFGCGTGLNLIAAGEMFPDKNLFGLDWCTSSCAIIDQLRKSKQLNIHGQLFDMYEPDNSLEIGEEDAVLTVGALEQLGSGFQPFLEFLLSKKPQVCLHLETMNELYTRKTAADFITLQYTKQRRYLTGFLNALRANEKQGKIRIMQVQRTFGGQYHDGYSFVAWQPISR